MDIISELYNVVLNRQKDPQEGSYTNYLLEAGTEKIAKKLGEEAVETAIAAAKSELQKAIDGKADKADLQALSDKVDGINTNLNNLSKDVDGI